jgi:hypothetical protein
MKKAGAKTDFSRGKATKGNLQPSIEPLKYTPCVWSAWNDVSGAFNAVGMTIRKVMDEQGKPASNSANQERRRA